MLPAFALALLLAADPAPAIDPATASRFFQEARLAAEADGRRLWGRPRGGRVLLADPKPRAAGATRRDRGGKRAPAGAVFAGRRPAGTMVANTAFNWSGVTWAMVVWPLPGSAV